MKYTVEIVYSISRRRVVSVFATLYTMHMRKQSHLPVAQIPSSKCDGVITRKTTTKKKKAPVICGQFLRFFCIVHYNQIKKTDRLVI